MKPLLDRLISSMTTLELLPKLQELGDGVFIIDNIEVKRCVRDIEEAYDRIQFLECTLDKFFKIEGLRFDNPKTAPEALLTREIENLYKNLYGSQSPN